jgi:hypothetical protein
MAEGRRRGEFRAFGSAEHLEERAWSFVDGAVELLAEVGETLARDSARAEAA